MSIEYLNKALTNPGLEEGKLLELRFSLLKQNVLDQLAQAEVDVNLSFAEYLERRIGLHCTRHVLHSVG